MLIVRSGSLVLEVLPQSYAGPGVKHKLYSATKSFTSVPVGIAIRKGFVDSVDQKVLDFFPEREMANLDERKRKITIEHLLRMTPGCQWDMGDGISHLLSAVLAQATGLTSLEFTYKEPLARANKGQQELIFQFSTVTGQGLELEGVIGAWYNYLQKRAYIFVDVILSEPGAELDGWLDSGNIVGFFLMDEPER